MANCRRVFVRVCFVSSSSVRRAHIHGDGAQIRSLPSGVSLLTEKDFVRACARASAARPLTAALGKLAAGARNNLAPREKVG